MSGDASSGSTPAEVGESFRRLAAAGHHIHGEASFVAGYQPSTVLDAGCGTGRVAIELARRGIRTVGVDIDRAALDVARSHSETVRWLVADLTTLRLTRRNGDAMRFHLVVAAGNVMLYLPTHQRGVALERLAAHLVPGGLLVAGFQLARGRLRLSTYDDQCAAAGLTPFERFSSWSRDPFRVDGGYVVAVHQLPVS